MELSKGHIVCIPLPAQGHLNPMMQVAKLLHSTGFIITYVLTDFAHRRISSSGGFDSAKVLEGFRFESIADGLSPSFKEIMDDAAGFCKVATEDCEEPFRELLRKLQLPSDGLPPVTCVVSDATMCFPPKIAQELGIPSFVFYPAAVCTFMATFHYPEIIRRGLVPLKDESFRTNGYLDTIVDWIPGMGEIKLKDLGSFLQTTDVNEYFLQFVTKAAQHTSKASKIIFNTFDDLEHDVLDAIRSMLPACIYTVGPLPLQCRSIAPNNTQVKSIKSSLWVEESECLKWLDNFSSGSVIYVNFGSTTLTTPQQLAEFAWGIANSNHPFLWVIRSDLVMNGETNLSEEFKKNIEGRGMLVSWCPQEEVLSHPSVALFLTHCGWNSTLESISYGVPMLCWPFFADQQIDCRYSCKEWGVGMEIKNSATREEIGVLIEEFMEGEKGKEMKKKASEWKKSAEDAVKEGGSSHSNLELLVQALLEAANKK